MFPTSRTRSLGAALVTIVAFAACSSPSAAGPTSTPATAAATSSPIGGPATSAPSTVPVTAAPATKAPAKLPTVDLVLSGYKSITMKGTAGTCMIGKNADGTPGHFGFQALESDYAGLGDGLFISEDNAPYATIKWLLDSKTGFINIEDVKGAVSADHLSITLDHDIKSNAGIEHIKGTVTCP